MSTVEYVLHKEKLPQYLKNVRQELLNIQSGEARWRRGPALHFEIGKAVPIEATLNRFQDFPSKENFDAFIFQATQDLGKPTGDGFKTWGQDLFHTIHEGKPTPTPNKKFEAKLFDGLYSVFKVARIQLEPKQIDAFEKAAAGLAKTFSEEIHREMKAQLSETVAKLKKAEEGTVTVKPNRSVGHGYND